MIFLRLLNVVKQLKAFHIANKFDEKTRPCFKLTLCIALKRGVKTSVS